MMLFILHMMLVCLGTFLSCYFVNAKIVTRTCCSVVHEHPWDDSK